jgi:hypothetical protein
VQREGLEGAERQEESRGRERLTEQREVMASGPQGDEEVVVAVSSVETVSGGRGARKNQ